MRLKANSFHIPLKDKSVQAVITSPPYWGLRRYEISEIIIGGNLDCKHNFVDHIQLPRGGKNPRPSIINTNNAMHATDARGVKIRSGFCKCGAWRGHYGWEPTVDLFVEHTLIWVREVWRVLKDNGVFFLNLGDSYGGSWQNYGGAYNGKQRPAEEKPPCRLAKKKYKLLIPHRVAIALIDDGWICRNDIIWFKPNAMPASVKDRFNTTHEKMFFMTKRERYYFDLDAVRSKEYGKTSKTRWRIAIDRGSQPAPPFSKISSNSPTKQKRGQTKRFYNPLGKNPGDVWSIASQPYHDAHYATFPEKIVERMILCSTRPGDIVLDPFAGSGTTGRVAARLRRKPIMLDLGYHDLQKERTNNVQIEIVGVG